MLARHVRCFIVLPLLLATSLVSAQGPGFQVRELSRGGDSLVIRVDITRHELLPIPGGWLLPQIEGTAHVAPTGTPDLPRLSLSYHPAGDTGLCVRILAQRTTDLTAELQGRAIAPRAGLRLRNQPPGPREANSSYQADSLLPGQAITLSPVSHSVRSLRQTVHFHPLRYNPARGQLELIQSITLSLKGVGHTPTPPPRTRGSRSEVVGTCEAGYMLIVTPPSLASELDGFITWKHQRGQECRLLIYDDAGRAHSEPHVKNQAGLIRYIQEAYDANQGLRYILLVGNRQTIPPQRFTGVLNQGEVDCDQPYGMLRGEDAYNEVFVGRLSCRNAGHLRTQLERIIRYERGDELSPTAYTQALSIASDEEDGGDNNETDIEHQQRIASLLIEHGYSRVETIYGTGTPEEVSQIVNQGVGLINYTGHGFQESWGTTGFRNLDVERLMNYGAYPFIMDVACNNGRMEDMRTCFAEQWMWSSRGGEAGGAVAILASSDDQAWEPPMRAQDAFNEYVCEIPTDCNLRTLGGLCTYSLARMLDAYQDNYGPITAKAWNLFGDPSTLLRRRSPQGLRVECPAQLPSGTGLTVSCPAENVYASLWAQTNNQATYHYASFSDGKALFAPSTFAQADSVQICVFGPDAIAFTSSWLKTSGASPGRYTLSNVMLHDAQGQAVNPADPSAPILVSCHLSYRDGPLPTPRLRLSIAVESNSTLEVVGPSEIEVEAFTVQTSLQLEQAFTLRRTEGTPPARTEITLTLRDETGKPLDVHTTSLNLSTSKRLYTLRLHDNNRGVGGAEVYLYNEKAYTDAQGMAQFWLSPRSKASSGYLLYVIHPDYEVLEEEVWPSPEELTIERELTPLKERLYTVRILQGKRKPFPFLDLLISGQAQRTDENGLFKLHARPGLHIVSFPHSTLNPVTLALKRDTYVVLSLNSEITALDPTLREVILAPNPVAWQLTAQSAVPIRLEALSLTGRILATSRDADTHPVLDLTGLPPGVYLIRITGTGGRTEMRHVVKM